MKTQSGSVGQCQDAHILSSLPSALHHVSVAQGQSGPSVVHLAELEPSDVHLLIVPSEPRLAVVHQSVQELALVPSVFSHQLALDLLAVLEPAFELAVLPGEGKHSVAMHLAVLELSLVGLSVFPLEGAMALLQAELERALIDRSISVGFLSMAMRFVVLPLPLVNHPVFGVVELPLSGEGAVLEVALVVGAILEDDQSVLALCGPFNKVADEVNPALGEHLAPSVLLSALPRALVVDIRG